MRTLNVSNNIVDLAFEEVIGKILERMQKFFIENTSLVHADLSACNFRDSILCIAQSIAESHSLNALHLSDNLISE